jgi:hypothetical protein
MPPFESVGGNSKRVYQSSTQGGFTGCGVIHFQTAPFVQLEYAQPIAQRRFGSTSFRKQLVCAFRGFSSGQDEEGMRLSFQLRSQMPRGDLT